MNIPGYQTGEGICATSYSVVYRGRREADGRPVILKVLKQAHPPLDRLTLFKREYETLRSLNLPGAISAFSLEVHQHRWVMVLEDFGGESLARLQIAGRMALTEFLDLAVRVAEILGQIHRQDLIHGDINPSTILLNSATGQAKLTGFGLSAVLSRPSPTIGSPDDLAGMAAYRSPEQIGRMDRTVDYRADFYSLGATFYELLTGLSGNRWRVWLADRENPAVCDPRLLDAARDVLV